MTKGLLYMVNTNTSKTKKVISGVYCIQNTINGKTYIGSSKNIFTRWSNHKHQLRANKHHNEELQKDWIKYGEDAFEFNILLETDIANAQKYETEYITKMQTEKFGYNVQPQGGYTTSIKSRYQRQQNLFYDIISDSYIADGNVYFYDFDEIARKMKFTRSDLLKFLGLNSISTPLNEGLIIEQAGAELCVLLNWDNDGIYIAVTDLEKYKTKQKRGETIEDIWVPAQPELLV